MNERIRELWSQAEEEIKAEYEDESRRNRRLYNEIFLPKFAQLIVKECQKLNSKELSITAIERLLPLYKEHFGVEE
jgi:hypothetical protein